MPHAKIGNRQRSRAKQLRQTMAFRRRAPMHQFIADFICHAARLIVEIDGESHNFDSRRLYDRKRDEWFASQRYAVLRFTNEQVLKNLNGVIEVIRQTALTRLKRLPPSLSLPHKEGGNNGVPVNRKSIQHHGPSDSFRGKKYLRGESRP